jgi:hypothetical protein
MADQTCASALYPVRSHLYRARNRPGALGYFAERGGSVDIMHAFNAAGDGPDLRLEHLASEIDTLTTPIFDELSNAVLRCYLGDAVPQLVRVSQPIPEFDVDLWLLTHKDLRGFGWVGASNTG